MPSIPMVQTTMATTSPEKDFQSRLEDLAPTVCGSGAFACGCWCPAGWEKLVTDLVVEVEREAAATGQALLRIDQIKEKFGGLRVYFNRIPSNKIQDLVSAAEKQAFQICDRCGQPGKPTSNGWIATRCDEHR